MANEEHVKLLKRSIEEWNKWREEQGDIRPDLSGANLIGANLNGANLSGANLSGANLNNANLNNANLNNANLNNANLNNANLNRANLSYAHLRFAVLNGANLFGADLHCVNLSFSQLNFAILSGSNLREAYLHQVELFEAKLDNTFMYGADLSEATLNDADLRDADLINANLRGAFLIGAALSRADLSGSRMGGTTLAFTNLSSVQGLDAIEHEGKSSLDLNTVTLPYGSARTALLRGVGYPETMIEYYDSIFTQPIRFYSCFISYTQADEEVAWKLYKDLQNAGIRCFFAPHDLKPGDYYHKRIDNAIQVHDKLLLLLSEQSVQSLWVEHEVMGARGREKRERREILFPLRLDDTVMEAQTDWAQFLRDTRHIGDMTRWQQNERYQAVFQEVVRHLKVGLIPPSK